MKAWKTILLAGAMAIALGCFPSAAKADIPLGIAIQNTPTGVVVVGVREGGIADRCMPRLRPGARIVTVNGNPLGSAEQFQEIVAASTYIRFEFIDRKGELRWAVAWSGRIMPINCGP